MDVRGIVVAVVTGLAGCAIGPVVADGVDGGDAGADAPPVAAWWCYDLPTNPGGFGGRQCYSDGQAACEHARPADAPPCYRAEP